MIVALSGASGAGKTTTARGLLDSMSSASMVPSYTTRDRRDSDLPGEYQYINKFTFWLIDTLGLFLWTVDVHGNKYGTLRWSVNRGLNNKDNIFIMILVTEKVGILLDYVRERGSEEFIFPFYIISPGRDVLKLRLEERGDNDIEIAKRLKDCEKWDSEASSSSVPYIFIRNDLDPSITVGKIAEYIRSEKEEEWF